MDLSKPIADWLPLMVYPGYDEDVPDLVVGRLPSIMVPLGRPGGAIKVWIVETPEESDALQAALNKPIRIRDGGVDFKGSLDTLVGGRSMYARDVAMIYGPSFDGWPWITLFRWPKAVGRDVQAQRGRYTYEIFDNESEAREYFEAMRKRAGSLMHFLVRRHDQ